MKMNEFNEKDFNTGEGLPKGDTLVAFETLDVDPIEQEYDGEKKVRYLLKIPGVGHYFVPKMVMKDLKNLEVEGFPKARITRTGEKLDTRYTIIGVE